MILSKKLGLLEGYEQIDEDTCYMLLNVSSDISINFIDVLPNSHGNSVIYKVVEVQCLVYVM